MKEDKEDIFDLENLDNVDSDVRELIKSLYVKKVQIKEKTKTQKILSLFDMKERLIVSEIIVGLFRKYDTRIKYHCLMTILSMLSGNKMLNYKNKIRKISNGLYEKITS